MSHVKYHLVCTECGKTFSDFGEWFSLAQTCSCGSHRVEARYYGDYSRLQQLCMQPADNLFHWFDFLPLNDRENIVTLGEGAVPLQKWDFLGRYALEKYGIHCTAVVSRSDLSGGTGTFKDPAAALGASLFREWGVKAYCAASTGNTATAFSRYCSEAGVDFTVFVPCDVCPDTVSAISSYGQKVVVSEGRYVAAKKEAADFSLRTGTLMTPGNIDAIRVESKRTLVFEYLRQLGRMPDVYVQAVAGGTAPIALEKGVRELYENCGGRIEIGGESVELRMPRIILAQQDTCAPMLLAWKKAVSAGFPAGWDTDYPSLTPQTAISILSTGTPGMYPVIAPIVRKSGGAFVEVREDSLVGLARWVRDEMGLVPGPASMVCIAGFLKALEEGLIKDGDLVSVNMGEGSGRACWFRKAVEG